MGESATVLKLSLEICQSVLEKCLAAAKVLRNQGGIWSGPQALFGSNEESCFKTPCSEIIKGPKIRAHFWNVFKVLLSKQTCKLAV